MGWSLRPRMWPAGPRGSDEPHRPTPVTACGGEDGGGLRSGSWSLDADGGARLAAVSMRRLWLCARSPRDRLRGGARPQGRRARSMTAGAGAPCSGGRCPSRRRSSGAGDAGPSTARRFPRGAPPFDACGDSSHCGAASVASHESASANRRSCDSPAFLSADRARGRRRRSSPSHLLRSRRVVRAARSCLGMSAAHLMRSMCPSSERVGLAEDSPRVSHRSDVPELVGVDHRPDRLNPAVEHVECHRDQHLTVAVSEDRAWLTIRLV